MVWLLQGQIEPGHVCVGLSFWRWHHCTSSKVSTLWDPLSELQGQSWWQPAVNSMLGCGILIRHYLALLVSAGLKHPQRTYSINTEIKWLGSVKPPSNLPLHKYCKQQFQRHRSITTKAQQCFKAFLWYKFISCVGIFSRKMQTEPFAWCGT